MQYDKISFLSGLAVGRALKGWATAYGVVGQPEGFDVAAALTPLALQVMAARSELSTGFAASHGAAGQLIPTPAFVFRAAAELPGGVLPGAPSASGRITALPQPCAAASADVPAAAEAAYHITSTMEVNT